MSLPETDPNGALTVSQSIKGLLAFASRTLPLLIYATIPTESTDLELMITRDEMLDITASLHIIQAQLPVTFNSEMSHVSIITESLVSSLAGCVLLFSEIEDSINKTQTLHRTAIADRLTAVFKSATTKTVVQELQNINSVLCLLADIVECRDTKETDSLSIFVTEQLKGRFERSRVPKTRTKGSVTQPAHTKAAGILEAPLPVRLSEIFNNTWYTSSIRDGGHSVIDELLLEATKVSWELPWPNTFGESSNKSHLADTPRQLSTSKDSIKHASKVNAEIDAYLMGQSEADNAQREILVWGNTRIARDIIKQLNLCYSSSQQADQLKESRSQVFNYLFYELELATRKAAKEGFEIPENSAYALYLCTQSRIGSREAIPPACLPAFASLWQDVNVKQALINHPGGRVFENFTHFYDDITRIFFNSYIPTKADMVHLNSFLAPITEHQMDINSTKYRIIDGSYLSRCHCCGRKWGVWFEDVTAILYGIDMSEYDQSLIEDDETLLFDDFKACFDDSVNSQRFRKAEILLLFTNIDRFREKIESGDQPVKKYFPAYQGAENDVDSALDFFTNFFTRADRVPGRVCSVEYTHERDMLLLQKLHSCLDVAIKLRGTQSVD